jgi:hypothetical protein
MKRLHTTTQRPARASWRGGQPLLVNPGIGNLGSHLLESNLLESKLNSSSNLARCQGSDYLFSTETLMDAVAHPSFEGQIKTEQPYRSGRCRFSLAPM